MEFTLTKELEEVCDQWLDYKGYEDIHDYGRQELKPNESVETQLGMIEGSIGYDEGYLYENLYLTHLRCLKITKESFLDFYFNTGDDGSQHQMRVDIGYEITNALLDGEEYETPTAESLFENCGYIRLYYCEGIDNGHPYMDSDNEDFGFDIEIKLI